MDRNAPVTLLYDGQCVICQQSKRIIRALDWLKRTAFVDLHDREAANACCPSLDFAAALGQMHLVTPDGTLLGGFLAMRRVLKELPLGYPVWLLLHLPGMAWLGDRAYRWVARHRYRINRLLGVTICEGDTCHTPS
ncbi:MAG: DUF393 domain-containing protein [Anaerolineaceae bacterium]|nr:DUF393 domain-containing protein [Anaerolineaceae bacterium]